MASVCALLVAGSAMAQNYSRAQQQAKNAAAREAQNQQAIDPAPAPAAPAAPPPAAPQPNPALELTLRSIANLRADFEKLDVNPTNKLSLINDLSASAHGAKASPATVALLADNLATAMSGNAKLRAQHQKLAQNIHATFNASHLTPSQQQQVFSTVQKALLDGGASAGDAAKVISSLKAVVAETK